MSLQPTPLPNEGINRRVNDITRPCDICGNPIPLHGGTEYDVDTPDPITGIPSRETFAVHIPCGLTGKPKVRGMRDPDSLRFSIVNVDGRCEDAPCCGCCFP